MTRLYRTIGAALLAAGVTAASVSAGSGSASAAGPAGGTEKPAPPLHAGKVAPGPAAPEAALAPAQGIVAGSGPQADDLLDEAELRNGGPYHYSNYTGIWQAIMWADNVMPAGEVDCDFGPGTAARTAQWQERFGDGIPVTGKLDWNTRNRIGASGWLEFVRESPDRDGDYLQYKGVDPDGLGVGEDVRYIHIRRHGKAFSYRWDVNVFGNWRGAWYDVVNFDAC
jgi:hypothetical protein